MFLKSDQDAFLLLRCVQAAEKMVYTVTRIFYQILNLDKKKTMHAEILEYLINFSFHDSLPFSTNFFFYLAANFNFIWNPICSTIFPKKILFRSRSIIPLPVINNLESKTFLKFMVSKILSFF